MRTLGIAVTLASCLRVTGAVAQVAPAAPPPPAAAVAPSSPATPSPQALRAAYEANLTACVKHAKACDRAVLSTSDQNYLTYEMGEQRFTAKDAEEVVAVRMEGYGQPETVILGRSTGTRYASTGGRRRHSGSSPSTEASSLLAFAGGGGCTVHVSGYTRRNGTAVRGYDRRSSRC